jgi:hypothetical protein
MKDLILTSCLSDNLECVLEDQKKEVSETNQFQKKFVSKKISREELLAKIKKTVGLETVGLETVGSNIDYKADTLSNSIFYPSDITYFGNQNDSNNSNIFQNTVDMHRRISFGSRMRTFEDEDNDRDYDRDDRDDDGDYDIDDRDYDMDDDRDYDTDDRDYDTDYDRDYDTDDRDYDRDYDRDNII